MSSRQNSLLTAAQREFLTTPKEKREEKYSKQQRSYHRQNIQERFCAGMGDIRMLVSALSLEDLSEVIEGERYISWRDVAELVVLGIELDTSRPQPTPPETEIPYSEHVFEIAIKNAFQKLGIGWREIEITIDRAGPLDELAQRDLVELSQEELDQLRAADKITRAEYAKDILRREEEAHKEAMRLGQQQHEESSDEVDKHQSE